MPLFGTPQSKPVEGAQRDSPVIPVVMSKDQHLAQVYIDSNRLKGGTTLDIIADRALTPDAGVVGLLARFITVSGSTVGLMSLMCVSPVGAVASVIIAAPIVVVTGLALTRDSHHKALASAYLIAIALGLSIFTLPALLRITSPQETTHHESN